MSSNNILKNTVSVGATKCRRAGPCTHLFEIFFEPVHVFLAFDFERSVISVEFEGDPHGRVHLQILPGVTVVILRVGRLEGPHPPRG